MGQLSRRMAQVLEAHGQDPRSWQADLDALAALEARDPPAAAERYREWKWRVQLDRRAALLAQLRRVAFVEGVPETDLPGLLVSEVERDIDLAERALRHVRAIESARAEAAEHRSRLRLRAVPEAEPVATTRWDNLSALAERVEQERRRAAGEARLEARILDAQRRATRLTARPLAAPELDSATVPDPREAEALLDAFEGRLREHEALDEAWRAALAPLREADVAAWRKESRRALEREAEALRQEPDLARATAGLRALASRTEGVRREAARLANEAARARKSGRRVPEAERRSSDPLDGYG